MKRMGVLGGISPQATMDFEARVHHVSQRLVPQHWNGGYPPMVVWYHRRLPIRVADDGAMLVPRQIDPQLVEAAAWLGRVADFLVIPCNTAHIGVREISDAAGCPVLSMIDVTLDEIERRRLGRVGVLGFGGASPLYLDPLRERAVRTETIGGSAQARLDAAIRAVMEGGEGKSESEAALDVVAALRARGVEGTVLGCTEIPLLLPDDGDATDLINPAALLAEAAVRFAVAV